MNVIRPKISFAGPPSDQDNEVENVHARLVGLIVRLLTEIRCDETQRVCGRARVTAHLESYYHGGET